MGNLRGKRLTLPDAVQRNDLAAAADLLRGGANANRKDPLGYTLLMLASGLGNAQMVELLLTAGADVHVLDDRGGASALHRAAQGGVVDVARLLVRRGAFVDLQAPLHGHTPLVDAAWNKRVAMVDFLVQEGAILSIRTHYGVTALDVARRDGLDDIARILDAAERALATAVEGQRLHTAAQDGDPEAVRRLIGEGAHVNEKSPNAGGYYDGHTPLMVAAVGGNAAIVGELLAAGANPRLVDHLMKATPGHKAGYNGHVEVARVLVEHGGLELDAQGPYNGYTALHDAIWHGHTAAARAYIEGGARLDLRALDGRTPLDMAVEYGYEDIAALIQAKAGGAQGSENC